MNSFFFFFSIIIKTLARKGSDGTASVMRKIVEKWQKSYSAFLD